MTTARDIVLWGGTGQARVLAEALRHTGIRVVAVIDNRAIESPLPDVPLCVGIEGLRGFLAGRSSIQNLHYAVAIGGDKGADRLAIADVLDAHGLACLTIVHPRAFVAEPEALGAGCQILAGAQIGTGNRLGRHVIANIGALVSHGCLLRDGVHLGPGAVLCGEIDMGEHAFVGANATILPRLRIGAGATIGAGAVVTRDVPAGATMAGNPGRAMSGRG